MLYALDDLIFRILDAWKTRVRPGLKKVASRLRRSISFVPEKFGFSRYPFFRWLRSFLFDVAVIIGGAALIAVIWYLCFTA